VKLLMMLVMMLVNQVAWAATAVEIESEQMSVDHLHNKAEFKGGVHLIRGDFDLRCDRLLAFYHENELQRAEAFGRVRMKQGQKRGASKHAIFNQATNILTLIGQASVEDEQGVIRGEKIIHHIAGGQTQVMQGEGGRVRLSLDSDEDVKQ